MKMDSLENHISRLLHDIVSVSLNSLSAADRAYFNTLLKFAYGFVNYYHFHLPGSYIKLKVRTNVSNKLNF